MTYNGNFGLYYDRIFERIDKSNITYEMSQKQENVNLFQANLKKGIKPIYCKELNKYYMVKKND